MQIRIGEFEQGDEVSPDVEIVVVVRIDARHDPILAEDRCPAGEAGMVVPQAVVVGNALAEIGTVAERLHQLVVPGLDRVFLAPDIDHDRNLFGPMTEGVQHPTYGFGIAQPVEVFAAQQQLAKRRLGLEFGLYGGEQFAEGRRLRACPFRIAAGGEEGEVVVGMAAFDRAGVKQPGSGKAGTVVTEKTLESRGAGLGRTDVKHAACGSDRAPVVVDGFRHRDLAVFIVAGSAGGEMARMPTRLPD